MAPAAQLEYIRVPNPHHSPTFEPFYPIYSCGSIRAPALPVWTLITVVWRPTPALTGCRNAHFVNIALPALPSNSGNKNPSLDFPPRLSEPVGNPARSGPPPTIVAYRRRNPFTASGNHRDLRPHRQANTHKIVAAAVTCSRFPALVYCRRRGAPSSSCNYWCRAHALVRVLRLCPARPSHANTRAAPAEAVSASWDAASPAEFAVAAASRAA